MNTFCQTSPRGSSSNLPTSLQATRTLAVPELPTPRLTESPRTAQAAAAQPSVSLDAAREQAMVEHLPLVRCIARRVHERLPQHIELEDLVSAGVVGLMDAFAKYDEAKQVQFRSYAQFRVRGAILDSLRTLDWGPRELRRQGRAIQEAQQLLTARLGRTPNETEMAEEVGLGVAEYQKVLGKIRSLEIGSLYVEHSEENLQDEVVQVPARSEESPLFLCLKAESRAQLAAAVESLAERERLVITLYYYEELTMREIGEVLSLGESRVSQLHSAAVAQLRSALNGDSGARNKAKTGRGPAGRARASMPESISTRTK